MSEVAVIDNPAPTPPAVPPPEPVPPAPQEDATPPGAAVPVPPESAPTPEGPVAKPTVGEYTFEPQDGVSLDPAFTAELVTLAQRDGLSPEKTREYAGLGVKMLSKWNSTITEKVGETLQQMGAQQRQAWIEEVKADKEFGGNQLNANRAQVRKALDKFGTPELSTFLDASGLGDHPEVLRLLYRVGKRLGEDIFVSGAPAGTAGTTSPKRRADIMYEG